MIVKTRLDQALTRGGAGQGVLRHDPGEVGAQHPVVRAEGASRRLMATELISLYHRAYIVVDSPK
jgi:hypothetical protein